MFIPDLGEFRRKMDAFIHGKSSRELFEEVSKHEKYQIAEMISST